MTNERPSFSVFLRYSRFVLRYLPILPANTHSAPDRYTAPMRLAAIDWLIVAAFVGVLVWAALRVRRYATSATAFLVAQRCAGRYVLTVANNIALVGVISLVWFFELNYEAGFTAVWWTLLEGPALIVMALTGWVIYRYRQTRAMTLAEFFERRYSRRFRVAAGLVAWGAGMINFGIFPAVETRFFMALCGLPERFELFGLACSTYVCLMALLLATALFFAYAGGLIVLLVTDFIQGLAANVIFIVLIVFLLLYFGWDRIAETLLAAPPGDSLVDPFDIGDEQSFGLSYFLISAFILFYGRMSWQGTQGYNAAAIHAHEAKMAGMLQDWRVRVLLLITLVVPICVRTYLHHPDFADQAAGVHAALAALPGDTPEQQFALRSQLRAPLTLAAVLPPVLLGLAVVAVLACFISTQDMYMHSWGSILVQDVVLPFRRRPLTPRRHLRLLRLSIACVAAFSFGFSLLISQTQYVAMFLTLTGAIFMAGAGAAIIGGLYWPRGTTAGAWAAMITGAAVAAAGTIIKQVDAALWDQALARHGALLAIPHYVKHHWTGMELTGWAMLASASAYVVVSLLSRRPDVDMDRLLHRGRYAIPGETATSIRDARTWLERLGLSRDFTRADRWVAGITLSWPVFSTLLLIGVSTYCLYDEIPDARWLRGWQAWTWLTLVAAAAVTVWFVIGGLRDLRRLLTQLRHRQHEP